MNDMRDVVSTSVLIVGGGSVGLTLVIDLAQRGVDVTVVEARQQGQPPGVKCNHVSARTMEFFRWLGFVDAVRNSGLPDEYPNDVSYRISFKGQELSRIPIPARKFRYTNKVGPDTWWPTPEPPHRINQIYLEPILFAQAIATPGLKIINEVQVHDLTQDGSGMVVQGTRLDDASEVRFQCGFLIGCDGGRSIVRKKIGANLSGDAEIGRVQSTYIRSPSLLGLSHAAPAWATLSFNTRRCGNVYAIDGKETWLIHNYLQKDEHAFDSVDRDMCIREILGVDSDFQYEVISNEDWIARRLIADEFREGRVFICGIASHLWVPMAGCGMNAGIADAMSLSWTMASHLQGWGDETMLDVCEAERLSVTEQVSHFAMAHAQSLQPEKNGVPANIEDDDEQGEATRSMAGQHLYDLNVKRYCCAGLNFGYCYDHSPVIIYDEEALPGYSMDLFTSSTVPGCRLPHFELSDSTSLYDRLGTWYTLLVFDKQADSCPLAATAAQRGLPLSIMYVECGYDPAIYRHKFVMSRPDLHVAWRGDSIPVDVGSFIDKLRDTAPTITTYEK